MWAVEQKHELRRLVQTKFNHFARQKSYGFIHTTILIRNLPRNNDLMRNLNQIGMEDKIVFTFGRPLYGILK